MNEFFIQRRRRDDRRRLPFIALIVGLALAMFFAVWESAKWRPVAWAGSALVTILRGLPENSGGAVYLFWLLAAAADAFGWFRYQSWVRADPGADGH